MKSLLSLLSTALLLLACSQTPQPSLYQQLGEEAGITAITDHLLYRIEHDPLIVNHFRDTDIPRFRHLLIEQLCELSGGPCVYSGATMEESHTGLNLNTRDFDRLVNHLISAMQQQGIPYGTQNQLLALLAPMYPEVIGR
ncbi:group I truncated hemoglobin [Alkalimonas mucilaginosa]|uniref:Group 1 truncated hemoglobin n=1 Tax=Alkalimonas mucilaginosa TaxID=3057676 RepID=A0ABU7JG67_9GAMM|nr:group 1 truncated hemoglobin [Alkalimonas sp. MEB004]MEE2024130.1 group 1 truncated hemoglobin [Alkalimonas sp. MEB004]